MPLDNNNSTDITIVEDLQIKKNQKISHQIDIVDQTVKTIDVEIVIQDQIQMEATIRTSLKTFPVQTFLKDTIQKIDPETNHMIETEIIRIIETDKSKTTSRDYSNNRSNYHRSNFISYHNSSRDNSQNRNCNYRDRQGIFPNHRREIIHNIRIHNKTLEVVHLHSKDKLT